MILPGISGSYILVLMGDYELVINSLATFTKTESLMVLVPVILGIIVGILTFAHILAWVFKRYHDQTIALLTGFIVGSLPVLWPWKNNIEEELSNGKTIVTGYDYYFPQMDTEFFIAFSIIIFGAALIIVTETIAKSKKTAEENDK